MNLEQNSLAVKPRPTIGSVLLKAPSPNRRIYIPEQGWTITHENVLQYFQQKSNELHVDINRAYKWLAQNVLITLTPLITHIPATWQQNAAKQALLLASHLTWLTFEICLK